MTEPVENSQTYFFSQYEILPSVRFSIIIPVKDEEEYIVKTLSSFANQVDIYGQAIDRNLFEILVLANNCSDKSVQLIKKFQLDNPDLNVYLEERTLIKAQANIGYVRRKLMECAYGRLIKNGGGIIMTTDGDTSAAPDWLHQTSLEIEKGADAVGGRILLYADEFESMDESIRLHHLKDEKYHLLIAELEAKISNCNFDPVPRHHQHFNGSFAITTNCYERSGGVPIVEQLEDCAFFERLKTIDAKVRHSCNVIVYTSARCVGRTKVGLSYQLGIWKNLGESVDDYLVESCDSITMRLTQKKSLMKLWKMKNDINEANFNREIREILLPDHFNRTIYRSFLKSPYFGQWYEELVNQKCLIRADKFPAQTIDNAIADFQIKVQEYSDHCLSQTSIL